MSHTHVIATHALTFLQAYDTLDGSMRRIEQHGDVSFPIPIPERMSIVVPAITCLAFAAEIAIKALLVHSADGSLSACPRWHDLGELFKKVPIALRRAIAKALKKPLHEVEVNLEKNAIAFQEWRYSYEGSAWGDEVFLRDFVKAALAQLGVK